MTDLDRDLAGIYQQHSFAVYRRCRQLLRSDAEAEEATQEVFLRLVEKPSAFAGRARISTYLYAAATNMCLNKLRHSALRNATWQEDVRYHHVEGQGAANPEDDVSNRQMVAHILREQDPTTALIAVYHFVDGLPQGEIAELVQLSRVTVNQRLGRFVQAARQRMGDAA